MFDRLKNIIIIVSLYFKAFCVFSRHDIKDLFFFLNNDTTIL